MPNKIIFNKGIQRISFVARWRMFALLIVITLDLTGPSALSRSAEAYCQQEDVIIANYCDLVREPEKYYGRKISTQAVLVAVIGPTANGPTILYSPNCNSREKYIIVGDHMGLEVPSHEYEKLSNMFHAQIEARRMIARAEITVTGSFNRYMRFSTSNYKYSLTILNIRNISEVKDSVHWPK